LRSAILPYDNNRLLRFAKFVSVLATLANLIR